MKHLNKKGNPYIVDVSEKKTTQRVASAVGEVKFDKETFTKIKSFKTKKGNLEKTAIIAGIMGAKETSKMIPLCHNIPINHVNIEIKRNNKKFLLIVESVVKTNANTGVEMEALTAVSVAALTIYDMCKSVDKNMSIGDIRLTHKTGGKSGVFNAK